MVHSNNMHLLKKRTSNRPPPTITPISLEATHTMAFLTTPTLPPNPPKQNNTTPSHPPAPLPRRPVLPLRPRPARPRPTTTACAPPCARGLHVRQDAVPCTKRPLRLRRQSTLSEIDVTTGDSSQPVHVWLVLTPLSRGAVRVRGRAKSVLNRVCDRCADEFAAVTDGVFEVIVLPEGDVQGGRVEEEDAEAVDWFHGGLVDLRLHVRDAVYLGLPTRALCCADCPGLSVQTAREEGGGARGESFE